MKRYVSAILAAFVFGGCAPALHEAVKEGDAARVRELLDDGADVNVRESSPDRLQYTPLHWAAYLGEQSLVRLLVSRGAELESEDPWYSTPLYLAAEQGHLEIVKNLAELGSEVNVRSKMLGYTPLHRAAWGPAEKRFGVESVAGKDWNAVYLEIAQVLLEKGAEVNALDNDGETPLDQAIEGGFDEMVALLRKHGGKTHRTLKDEGLIPGTRLKEYRLGPITVTLRETELSEEQKELP